MIIGNKRGICPKCKKLNNFYKPDTTIKEGVLKGWGLDLWFCEGCKKSIYSPLIWELPEGFEKENPEFVKKFTKRKYKKRAKTSSRTIRR